MKASKAFHDYIENYTKLCRMESEEDILEAEILRDEMDLYWRQMSEEERSNVRQVILSKIWLKS